MGKSFHRLPGLSLSCWAWGWSIRMRNQPENTQHPRPRDCSSGSKRPDERQGCCLPQGPTMGQSVGQASNGWGITLCGGVLHYRLLPFYGPSLSGDEEGRGRTGKCWVRVERCLSQGPSQKEVWAGAPENHFRLSPACTPAPGGRWMRHLGWAHRSVRDMWAGEGGCGRLMGLGPRPSSP